MFLCHDIFTEIGYNAHHYLKIGIMVQMMEYISSTRLFVIWYGT